jgi:hypothetical protein
MSKVKTAPTIENIIDEMHQLSEDDLRMLAGAILEDRQLEPFVEELEDHLRCERAADEGPPERFTLN